ncbi:MAG: hypothetical protein QMB71_06820 [Tolumonas sp.]
MRGLLLLSVVWHKFESLSYGLWGIGAIVQLSLTLLVMHSWIHHDHYRLEHANPSWFIPVVGNIIAPITGAKLGYIEVSWFFFSVGIARFQIISATFMERCRRGSQLLKVVRSSRQRNKQYYHELSAVDRRQKIPDFCSFGTGDFSF